MSIRTLKFPAPVFCAILSVEQPILRKWISGNSLGAGIALALDGDMERASESSPRFYSYTDLVRVLYVQLLRNDYGVSTSRAIQIANAAFSSIASAVGQSWDAIESAGYQWGYEGENPSKGPWLIVRTKGAKLTAALVSDTDTLAETFGRDQFQGGIVSDIRILTQIASVKLGNDRVEADVKQLLENGKAR
jgi:hypothetical protein